MKILKTAPKLFKLSRIERDLILIVLNATSKVHDETVDVPHYLGKIKKKSGIGDKLLPSGSPEQI